MGVIVVEDGLHAAPKKPHGHSGCHTLFFNFPICASYFSLAGYEHSKACRVGHSLTLAHMPVSLVADDTPPPLFSPDISLSILSYLSYKPKFFTADNTKWTLIDILLKTIVIIYNFFI